MARSDFRYSDVLSHILKFCFAA